MTGRGNPVRNGIWLGVLTAAQLFISEEALVDTAIAAVIILALLMVFRPRAIRSRLLPSLVGLATGAVIALVLCARGLWVQFHGVRDQGRLRDRDHSVQRPDDEPGTLPYAFVDPSNRCCCTRRNRLTAAYYPQPTPEYLAYLGVR